jgi:hypothetical protein
MAGMANLHFQLGTMTMAAPGRVLRQPAKGGSHAVLFKQIASILAASIRIGGTRSLTFGMGVWRIAY